MKKLRKIKFETGDRLVVYSPKIDKYLEFLFLDVGFPIRQIILLELINYKIDYYQSIEEIISDFTEYGFEFRAFLKPVEKYYS